MTKPHIHVRAGNNNDSCALCGRPLLDQIHQSAAAQVSPKEQVEGTGATRPPSAPAADYEALAHEALRLADCCDRQNVNDVDDTIKLLKACASALRELASALQDAERLAEMVKATYSHINGRDLLHELQPNGAHYIDIVVRINGQYRRYQGDWLKSLTHARDGHNMGEYADNPKLRAMIEQARNNESKIAIDAAQKGKP